MARKNLIGVSFETGIPKLASNDASMISERPIAGFIPSVRSAPVGGITKTLGNITQKVERVNDLEKKLAEGQMIVAVDPDLIDGSFVSDRLGIDTVELAVLVQQIREHGQQVPILLRPHPGVKGRYQVAYGHRRLAAIRELGIKVRAVVRELSDDELVVSQGQENNARTNLSFIERALFAFRLEERTFGRDTIMSAIGVDKAALSRMLGVVKQVPIELIEAIGSAPEVGRRRWMELTELLPNGRVASLMALLSADNAKTLSSDQRFQTVVDALRKKPERTEKEAQIKVWVPTDKTGSVSVRGASNKASITVEAEYGLRFANFITGQLDDLYEAFRKSETGSIGD